MRCIAMWGRGSRHAVPTCFVRYPSIAQQEGAALLLKPTPAALAIFQSLGRCVAVEDEEKFRYLACDARTCSSDFLAGVSCSNLILLCSMYLLVFLFMIIAFLSVFFMSDSIPCPRFSAPVFN